VCKFGAITVDFNINQLSCEGCTICSYVCPATAIILKDRISGHYFISNTDYGKMVHAKLGIAQENSGKLVTKLREIAKEIAESESSDFIIIDGPPGVGCPVMASMTGVDLAVAITEPTFSGIHDLKRIIELTKHFNIELKVIINKYDLNSQISAKIAEELENSGIEVIGMIPFSEEILASIKAGMPYLKFSKDKLAKDIEKLLCKII